VIEYIAGLGLAGMLRRLKLWAVEDAVEGRLVVEGREMTRWVRAAHR
jgi:hypothetical protein